jgi:hypothetical protein
MKEKILKLIYLELDSIETLNFHYDFHAMFKDYPPARRFKYAHRKNWLTGDLIEHEAFEIDFTLKFPDGEPDIQVYTNRNIDYRQVMVKKGDWFRKDIYESITTRNPKVSIRCGKHNFQLTDEEAKCLCDATILAYESLQKWKTENEELRVLKKLENRIEKHKK